MRTDFTPILMRTWVASGITVAVGAGKLISGAISHHKDQKQLDALKQPFEQVQGEYFQNRNLAEQMAGQGLPYSEMQYLTQGAERGLGTGVKAAEMGGATPNDISMLLQGYNDNINKIGAQDAETHMNNIRYFMDVNKQLAEQKEKTWAVNELQPYEAKLKQLQTSVQTDTANEYGAFDSIASGVMSGFQGNQYKSLLNQLYGQKQQAPQYSAPYATNTPSIATTTPSGTNSPAADVGTINANSYSPGAVVSPWERM
jgi:hypothetical protein